MTKFHFLLKLFLITGTLYGMGMGLVFFAFGLIYEVSHLHTPTNIGDGIFLALSAALLSGFLFGSLMTISLGTIHFMRTDETSAFQEQEVVIAGSQQKAWDICFRVLQQMPDMRFKSARNGHWPIEGRTKSSWWRFGEEIRCRLIETSPEQQTLKIQSFPITKSLSLYLGIYVDFGVNKENVDHLVAMIGQEKTKETQTVQSGS